jgi:N-acetylated-alpha-linked acidic dipeptidase
LLLHRSEETVSQYRRTFRLRRFFAGLTIIAAATFGAFLAGAQNAATDHLQGFFPSHRTDEAAVEGRFRAMPDPAMMRDFDRRLSAYPHNLGSAHDRANAEWLLEQFKKWGWDAHIERFDVLFPTPKVRLLEMTAPQRYVARLKEPPVAGDPTSNQAGQLPTYNAYSPDGDVTAPLVYVNYGLPDDYEELARLGVSVKGRIVIARYGKSWRGIKPKVAAEHGAIGCIIYSDPRDDGYFVGDAYSKGPYRPEWGVQRGSVMQMELHPGDPETPGYGSVPGAHRLPLSQADTLEKIPDLPIAWGDALPLLKNMGGPVAPEAWRGALPITYHVGPGPATVHLKASFNWNIVPVYDVIAELKGSVWPDQWVVRGNHEDAWVNGADDPLSGLVGELAEARALGKLSSAGWKPRRTIIYAVWDGEEPGLLGSTEWAETHARELSQNAVAYINTDDTGLDHIVLQGDQTLEHFINGVVADVAQPGTELSIWQSEHRRLIAAAKTPTERRRAEAPGDLRIEALGSGTDYSVFLQHLGIPALNLLFDNSRDAGIYHSIYDDFYWYSHFSDRDFTYGKALAQVNGTSVLRLADADLIPFQYSDFSDAVAQYLQQLQELVKNERAAAFVHGGAAEEATVPQFDFTPLLAASAALKKAAGASDDALHGAAENGTLADAQLANVNHLLMDAGRKLLSTDGLPRRPWYKNQIYAPGFYTGYAVKTLPGVREALEQKRWDEATREQAVLVQTLNSFAQALDTIRQSLH